MNVLAKTITQSEEGRAIERTFPIVPLSQLSERESWRKELGRPLYHIHKWWATRLGSVFRAISLGAVSPADTDIWEQFYQPQDFSDKVVLDPFMGSGTTLGEALKLGCSVIGSDINPVSTFLVRQALTPVEEPLLRAAFKTLESAVGDRIKHFYRTQDRETGHIIPVLYAFWVNEVETPEGEWIPLFSKYVFSKNAYPKRKPQAQIVCPGCWEISEARYDTEDMECSACRHRFNPQTGPASGQFVTDKNGKKHKIKELLPRDGSPPRKRMYALMVLRETGKKSYVAPNSFDFELLKEARKLLNSEVLPLPTSSVRSGHNTNQARGYGFLEWADFFNDRQKLCLGLLLREILKIEQKSVRDQMVCLFSSTLEFNNRFCSFKGEGTGAVRHMFSHHILKPERTPLENSVWGWRKSSGTFSTLFESRLLKAKRYLDEPFELAPEGSEERYIVASAPIKPDLVEEWPEQSQKPFALVLNEDSSCLPLPDACVDAVVTDPPYFDFIHYSELSDFFYAWLKPALGDDYPYLDYQDCGSEGEVQHKDASRFAKLLSGVFGECHRVLKDDGVLTFSFHHSRAEGWAAIYEAISDADLKVVAAHPLHAESRGSSPKSATRDPISLDIILVCKKSAITLPLTWSSSQIIERVKEYAFDLTRGEMKLSQSDLFVIAAGEALKVCNRLTTQGVCDLLNEIRLEIPSVRSFLGPEET